MTRALTVIALTAVALLGVVAPASATTCPVSRYSVVQTQHVAPDGYRQRVVTLTVTRCGGLPQVSRTYGPWGPVHF